DNPCNTIAYAILQISIEKGSSADAIIPEKKIGIHQGGYDLTAPYQFSKSNSYTDCVKIMKQLYGTSQAMNEQAELKIIKGSQGSTVESEFQGWISASGGIELRIYGVKIITDLFNLLIPVIYTEGQNSILELDDVTFFKITLAPATSVIGMIYMNVDNSELIATGCLFQEIKIEDNGGSAIHIPSIGNKQYTATISNCIFDTITAERDQTSSYGGAAINLCHSPNGIVIIKDQCEFIKCIKNNLSGGGIYIRTNNGMESTISNASFNLCKSPIGGGIYATISAGGKLTINGQCTFTECEQISNGRGSGIAAEITGASSQLILEDNINFYTCKNYYVGTIHAIVSNGAQMIISSDSLYQTCSSQYGSSGGMYVQCYDSQSKTQITGVQTFDHCTSYLYGGGAYLSAFNSGSIELLKVICIDCTGSSGGGIFADVQFSSNSFIQIIDSTFQNCHAKYDSTNTDYPSGFGGGLFLTGNGDYEVSSGKLNLKEMKIFGNNADKAGQSMYVVITKVVEWCQLGTLGEFVKGNYSDINSNDNELEGIAIQESQFKSLLTELLNQQQKPLEFWWDNPKDQLFHISNRENASPKGLDKQECAKVTNPCKSIDFAIKQISVELAGYETQFVQKKNIGICSAGYDLTAPYQFSKTSSLTDVIRIVKEQFGTASVMEEQAEIKIIKGSSGSTVESGNQGWISATGGIQLRIYGIKIVTDDSTLNIPIIYIEGETSVLELNTVTLTGINYISPSNPDDSNPERFIRGLIHIDVDDSIFIASGCLFKDINIDSGGNTIRIH
ncbi:MAG: hypothetical protein EZS28_036558, partial [Streblomastix strix]